MPTVNASTRRLGSDTEMRPPLVGSCTTPDTTSWMPEKSAVDSDVSATSS